MDNLPLLDPLLTRNSHSYARTTETQLQFKFEAVERSSDFPLGVHTQYRAYSSPEVCEITKCAPSSALDVGFTAHVVKCGWFPAVVPDEAPAGAEASEVNKEGSGAHGQKRKREGYLNVLVDLPDEELLAAGFLEGATEKLEQTVRTVHSYFRDQKAVTDGWDKFAKECPSSDSAADYVRDHPLRVPLLSELFGDIGVRNDVFIAPVKPRPRNLEDLPVARSTASVHHAGNHGIPIPPPRIYEGVRQLSAADRAENNKQMVTTLTPKVCKANVLKNLINEINESLPAKVKKISQGGTKTDMLNRYARIYACLWFVI